MMIGMPTPRRTTQGLLSLPSVALAALALGAPACADEGGADGILQRLQDDDYRANYRRAPGWETPRSPKAGGPHGAFVDIYVNDVVAEAIDAGAEIGRWPEGALIVKDGWDSADTTTQKYLAVMERTADGWFWVEWEGDGSGKLVVAREDAIQCVGCHSSGEDHVRAFGLPPY